MQLDIKLYMIIIMHGLEGLSTEVAIWLNICVQYTSFVFQVALFFSIMFQLTFEISFTPKELHPPSIEFGEHVSKSKGFLVFASSLVDKFSEYSCICYFYNYNIIHCLYMNEGLTISVCMALNNSM